MDTRSGKPMFVRGLYIMAIMAVALSASSVVYAAPPSPFIGHWQATDLDGSEMGLNIGGRPAGPFNITWTDKSIRYCDGEAGILRGKGVLNAGNSNLLEADLLLECLRTGETLELHVTWRYHPSSNTLSIRYSFGQVTIWHRPGGMRTPPPTLNLRVNYGHDWVESFYEGGHTAWITVTESDGVTVKATAELVTEPKWYWNGETGFQSLDSVWLDAEGNPMEYPPDIQPNDWVFGWMDNGASAQVQLGDISGFIILAEDAIEGTINAPWITGLVQVECLDWGSGGEPYGNKDGGLILTNDADAYACSWAGEWDIQPYQDVGVGYMGADGHWVANAFFSRNPRIFASEAGDWFWTTEFFPGELDLLIYESNAEDANLLWSGRQDADEGGFTIVGYDVHGIDLVPGNYLIVYDGVNQKSLVLEAMTAEIFDIYHDFMAGTAPAGSNVWVAAGPQDWQTGMSVAADPLTGAWTADFTTIPFDITEEMQPWSYAQIFDEDGDANEADPPPLELWAAVFTYEHGTWPAGNYSYYFEMSYTFPVHDGSGTTPVAFTSSSDAPLYDGYVMLRPQTLRARVGGECPAIDPILHPDQATRFVYGWVTDYPMTYEEALAHFDSMTVRGHWDGGLSAELVRHEIIPFASVDWAQYVCSFTE